MESLYRISRHLSGQRQGGGFEFATGNNQINIVIFSQNKSNVQGIGNDGKRFSINQKFGNLGRRRAGIKYDGIVVFYKRNGFPGNLFFFLQYVSD